MFEHILQSVSGADWAIVTATLLGPILAVQAQKAVNLYRGPIGLSSRRRC